MWRRSDERIKTHENEKYRVRTLHLGVVGEVEEARLLVRIPQVPAEMELSDMRRRQSRRTLAPLLSTENDGEVADGSGRREKAGLRRRCLRFVGLEEKVMGV